MMVRQPQLGRTTIHPATQYRTLTRRLAMTAQQITAEENGGTVPVACTLTSADLAAQSDRWEQLAARAMTERAETAHGLRIFFRSEPGAEEELRALVAVENECCPWADWTVETNNGQIVLNVRSTRQGVATLHAMFRASNFSGGETARLIIETLGR
jgi:hypothetical protein